MTLRIGSLCSGYGGLDMGVQQVLDAEVAWHCEYAPGPSRILAHHYPDLPNHHDLTTTDWDSVEPVDIITAGWPCQPWSLAGKGKGAADERAIWPEIAGAVRALRPRYVFLENVSAVVVLGELARAAGDLAALGYVGAWRCLRAADIGAPHGRNRCFIVAKNPDVEPGVKRRAAAPGQAEGGWSRPDAGRRDPRTAADTRGDGREGRQERDQRPEGGVAAPQRGDADRRSDAVADAGGQRRHRGEGVGRARWASPERGEAVDPAGNSTAPSVDWGRYAAAVHRWESALGRRAPLPTEPGARGGQRLNPALVEWMMGLPAGWVTEVPGLTRIEQLKALGNGVVPQQAAAAYADLLDALVPQQVAA